jgi:hypothetical protein
MSIVVEHLPAEVMWMTPSHSEGLDEETELALRVYGCELIQEAGILLKLYVMALYQARLVCSCLRVQATGLYGHSTDYFSSLLLQEIVSTAGCEGVLSPVSTSVSVSYSVAVRRSRVLVCFLLRN